MRVKSIVIALLVMLAAGASVASAEDLVSIGNDAALYRAKAKREEARRDFEKNQSEADRYAGTTSNDAPTVNWIEGVGKTLTAQLQLDNGAKIQAREGDLIDNRGTRVTSVKPGEVMIKRAGKLVRLATTPQQTNAYGQSGASASPYLGGGMPPNQLPMLSR